MTPPDASPARSPDRRTRGALGPSLIVFLLSVAAAFAVPALQRARLEARADVLATDLRTAAEGFQTFAHERGDWPPAEARPGMAPAGMQELLASTNWSQPTPIGGHLTWRLGTVHRGQRYTAAIVITPDEANPVRLDRALALEIDRLLDDADLSAGRFQLGFRNLPVFVLEY